MRSTPSATDARARRSPGKAGSSQPNVREPVRVLVVEDDLESAEALVFILNASGFDAIAAHDGASAVEAAREFGPALIVVDLLLPDCNGIELAEALDHDRPLRQAPKIAVTAALDRDWRDEAFRAGYDRFLSKPVSPPLLLASIEDLLRSRDAPA